MRYRPPRKRHPALPVPAAPSATARCCARHRPVRKERFTDFSGAATDGTKHDPPPSLLSASQQRQQQVKRMPATQLRLQLLMSPICRVAALRSQCGANAEQPLLLFQGQRRRGDARSREGAQIGVQK